MFCCGALPCWMCVCVCAVYAGNVFFNPDLPGSVVYDQPPEVMQVCHTHTHTYTTQANMPSFLPFYRELMTYT